MRLLNVSASSLAGEGAAPLRVLCQLKELHQLKVLIAKAALLWTAGHDYNCKSSYACRMDPVREQLQKLNSEMDDLTAEIKVARDNWLKAQDAPIKASLENFYEDLKEEKQLLNTRRAKLEDKLPSSGEHSVQIAFAEAALAVVGTSA